MKTEKAPVLISEQDGIPCFQYDDQKFCFLNGTLEVKIGGVVYHLTSRFSEKSEMGEVIDTIELERSQRMSA